MNAFRLAHYLILLCLPCALVLPGSAAAPDTRDRDVLDALLSHLRTDTDFNLTKVSAIGATIVLHTRTPVKTGFLAAQQIRSEIDNHPLPADAENNLRQRNTPADAKPDSYDSIPVFYTNLTFASGIVVTNLSEIWKQKRPFEETFPKARGWVAAFLPGYSKDGTQAVIRAAAGPWAHAAMLTAVLEKRGGQWVVVWYHVSLFA